MPFWVPPHLFPVGSDEIEGIFQKFSSHLFGLGEVVLVGVFEKISWYSVNVLESVYCPFTYSMFESHFVPPSKRFLHLTHGWRSFCQPIRREILLQSLTATFAAEKRHDFWKNIPTILYRNFQSRKTTHFPKLFQKSFLLLYRKFFRSNLNPYFKNFFSTTVTGTFAVLSGTQIAKKA